MGGLQVGLLDMITASKPAADTFTRANYLSAVGARADSFWVPDHLNAIFPRAPSFYRVVRGIKRL
ncbi:hypothetical protein ACP6C7_11430 [Mycolicibacterium septicum]|uniref:Uncharacterized protein n=1 Tax=Mycolicibacterium septicum TaxID=98668 RepID=A0ABW9M1A3_9MYCO